MFDVSLIHQTFFFLLTLFIGNRSCMEQIETLCGCNGILAFMFAICSILARFVCKAQDVQYWNYFPLVIKEIKLYIELYNCYHIVSYVK